MTLPASMVCAVQKILLFIIRVSFFSTFSAYKTKTKQFGFLRGLIKMMVKKDKKTKMKNVTEPVLKTFILRIESTRVPLRRNFHI